MGMGGQLPRWCLFVLLDFRLYVALEGFEPSRHELDPGSQFSNTTQAPPMPPTGAGLNFILPTSVSFLATQSAKLNLHYTHPVSGILTSTTIWWDVLREIHSYSPQSYDFPNEFNSS